MEAVKSSAAASAEGSSPFPEAAPKLDARAERVLATSSGHLLVFGWMADDGAAAPTWSLLSGNKPQTAVCCSLLRHARADVEAIHGIAVHDFGYALLVKLMSPMHVPDTLHLAADGREVTLALLPERVSERRLLEEILAFLGSFQANTGREAVLARFLREGGRDLVGELTIRGQKKAARVRLIEHFGPGRTGPSFMTVLFGSVEAAMFQPLLFAKAGIDFGEWIYVCNSAEQAEDLVRLARTASRLHDLPIRVVVLNGNAGFGGANNLAIGMAASGNVVLINPDVYPIPIWAERLNRAMSAERFGNTLRGGLLFYDDEMLMHGGMYLDEDVYVSRDNSEDAGAKPCRLLRVEHYDKGVPFIAEDWVAPRSVPAVTGAVMAFGRAGFEKLGGFSSDFAYGHYEDADLCLRWSEVVGPVEVDPDIRLVHLEGQGSKTRLPHFHGAAIVNRHIFDARTRGAQADHKSSTALPL